MKEISLLAMRITASSSLSGQHCDIELCHFAELQLSTDTVVAY
jgi:hypothetical protein